MKVLVTGGAGYIGSNVVNLLIEQGEEVVVFDNLYQGHVDAIHPKATFVQGDLADLEAVDALFAAHQFEGILHFASHTLVGESMEQPFLYLRENVVNGLNLLETAVKYGVKKFILSSTANLFDQPEEMPITEKERIIPGSPYGESKAILERFLYWLDRTKGMKYAALRYFNASGASTVYGEDHDPETHLIPLVLQVAQGKREKIYIFGDDYDTADGSCVRDYIHVRDLASAHVLALRALDQGKSLTYNLGTGSGYSVKELIDMAREITGHPIPAEVIARRPGDPATLVASSEKIQKELGWRPEHSDLRNILQTAWDWHEKNRDGYTR